MAALYDDGRIAVSKASLSTPSQVYPLTHATARIRRDLYWLAASSAALTAATLAIYGDLLTLPEIGGFFIAPAAFWLGAKAVGVLVLDSPGHPRTFIIAGSARIKRIFAAIRAARAAE